MVLSDSLDPAIFHSVLFLTRKHHHIQDLHIADLLKLYKECLDKWKSRYNCINVKVVTTVLM